MKLDDLKPAPYNPRTIDDKALRGLQASLDKFGDVAGIVWNKSTGHLVAGHQRVAALAKQHGKQLKLKGAKDNYALVTSDGARFPVRVVEWSADREKAANVAANNPFLQGAFDDEALQGLLAELKETDWGQVFQELRYDKLEPHDVSLNEVPDEDVPVDESHQVIVDCDTEDEQRKVFDKLTTEGYRCRVLTL